MSKTEKPMLAYAVLENDERTGGIIYATSNIAARRQGANEYGDGELSYVTCNRAPWADEYYGKALPVSVMVDNGWHFECSHCGGRIDEDMVWEKQIQTDDIIGHQFSLCYCDARCEAGDALDKANREHVERRWVRRFMRIVRARFPEAKPIKKGAYASRQGNHYAIQEVSVEFEFPGQQFGPATLSWQRRRNWRSPYDRQRSKPRYTCCNGDREAFEAYAAATRPGGQVNRP